MTDTTQSTRLPAPFAGAAEVAVMLPPDGAALGEAGARQVAGMADLLYREPRELEVELGAPVRFVAADPGHGPRFLIGPAAAHPALAGYGAPIQGQAGLWFDRTGEVLIADAPDMDGIYEAINLLRSLRYTGESQIVAGDCRDITEAVTRLEAEVAVTYPAFALRGLDWAAICARHHERALAASDPLAAFQHWLAELQDGHTWARPVPPVAPLPYALWVTPERAVFAGVPEGTAAWEAGVRPGHELLEVDPAEWWTRTGSADHARPLLAGRRLLAGPPGTPRAFVARSPQGTRHTWTEVPTFDPPFDPVRWQRLPSGTGYLHVAAWRIDHDFAGAVDAAFADLRGCERLIVDLRGNTGGNLNLAVGFRDRFLRERTLLGTVRFSTGDGGLSEPQNLVGEPAPAGQRWAGPVRFLTDPATASASEDALLGLQGLPHVRVVGEPSNGGSGRPRTVRLLPGIIATISTALTYDRAGHCVEGAGIPVDDLVVPDRFNPAAPDAVLRTADLSW